MKLIGPDHELYDELRRPALPHYRHIRPAAIARCSSTQDVVEALAYAHSHGLPVAPRSGAHCFAGRSSTTGLLLDLSGLSTISVAEPTRVGAGGASATIGAGARLAAVYGRLHEYGLTIPAGCGPTVGIAGLTLGGGLGLLGRRYGLTCDRLVEATVVLAGGRVVECSQEHEPDLFWALRGAGGGQFGVVTSFVFAAVPSPAATRFTLTWPRTRAAEVIDAWQTWAPDAPDTITASLTVTADEARVFGAALTPASGHALAPADLASGHALSRADLGPLGELGGDLRLRSGLTWPALKRSFSDEDTPDDRTIYSKSEFFTSPLSPAAIAQLLTTGCDLNFTPMGGAYNRVPVDATAFAHRTERFLLEHAGPDHDAVRRSWSTARPHASGHLYPNFPDPDLTDWQSSYHGANYERLVAIKRKYDPQQVFNFPQALGGVR